MTIGRYSNRFCKVRTSGSISAARRRLQDDIERLERINDIGFSEVRVKTTDGLLIALDLGNPIVVRVLETAILQAKDLCKDAVNQLKMIEGTGLLKQDYSYYSAV